jgi:hypothetical protein
MNKRDCLEAETERLLSLAISSVMNRYGGDKISEPLITAIKDDIHLRILETLALMAQSPRNMNMRFKFGLNTLYKYIKERGVTILINDVEHKIDIK